MWRAARWRPFHSTPRKTYSLLQYKQHQCLLHQYITSQLHARTCHDVVTCAEAGEDAIDGCESTLACRHETSLTQTITNITHTSTSNTNTHACDVTLTICAITTTSATCRISVDLPPMLGPVTITHSASLTSSSSLKRNPNQDYHCYRNYT